MALDAFLLGFDTPAQGDWLGNRGSLGYCMAGPSLIVSGSIVTAVGRHPASGGVNIESTPSAATERRSLWLPNGSARSPRYWVQDGSIGLWRYQGAATGGWVLASVYLCDFRDTLATPGVIVTETTTSEPVATYERPGDYREGVWVRFAVRATGAWRIVIPANVPSSGAFFDPYFPHFAGGLNQYFVGHGAF